ncbi:MAG: endolytic transglycosylase MltG [Paracoccaceae bacterium]
MFKHVTANFLTLIAVGMFLAAGLVGWGTSQWTAPGPHEEAFCLRVPSGGSMRGVSERLADRGAVVSPAIFRAGTEYTDVDGDLKAGAFLIPEGASMAEIAAVVTGDGQSTCGTEVVYRIGVNATSTVVRVLEPETGRFERVALFGAGEAPPPEYAEARAAADTRFRVAVAEGVTSWQVATSLSALDLLEDDVGAVPPEGSLAPDSYEFRPGADASTLIARMAAAQEAILAEEWDARADGLPYASPEEALIMASIVEKETGQAEERPQVASVFVNRLRQGMRLQTDPTVIYGVTNGEGVLGRGLRQSELDRVTPYNTYQIDGLPPTPIANPGRAAIRAALNPDSTEYVFFVADGTGGHAFARTLEEHNANVRVWRAIEAERAAAEDG